MTARKSAKKKSVAFTLPRDVEVPKDGLVEFFLNRGWVIHRVIEPASHSAVDDAMTDARKHGSNALVVWRAGTTAYVLVRGSQRLHRKGKRP
jgi:hypothetical protein